MSSASPSSLLKLHVTLLLRPDSAAWRRAGRKWRVKQQRRKRLNKQLARSKLQTVRVSMTTARKGRSSRASEATPGRGTKRHRSKIPVLCFYRVIETRFLTNQPAYFLKTGFSEIRKQSWLVKSRVSITRWKHWTSTSFCEKKAQAKIIDILMIKVDRLFPFYSSRCFLKEIRNIFSVFLSSYRITRESLEKLKKLWKLYSISCSPKLPLVFLLSN